MAGEALEAEAEGFGPMAGGDVFQSPADVLGLHSPSAYASGISSTRHVADAVHSALKRKHSGLKPSSRKVSRQEPLLLQLGDPCDLMVDVQVTNAILQRTLIFLSRPCEGELGKIEEVGALVRRLDVEKGGLQFLQD